MSPDPTPLAAAARRKSEHARARARNACASSTRLRHRSGSDQPSVPQANRASTASLNQRNELLLAENRRLRDQVADLTAELAIAYGQRRAQDLTIVSPRATDVTSEGRL